MPPCCQQLLTCALWLLPLPLLLLLQGASVAAYGATGSGVIADVYKPQERGMALGIVTIPMVS
jgi:MFS family permease